MFKRTKKPESNKEAPIHHPPKQWHHQTNANKNDGKMETDLSRGGGGEKKTYQKVTNNPLRLWLSCEAEVKT